MSVGRRLALHARRLGRRLAGPTLALAAVILVGVGALDGALERPRPLGIVALAALVLVVAHAVTARLALVPPSARAARVSWLARWAPTLADVHAGLALVAGSYGLTDVTGGEASPLQPAIYLVVAFAATFQTRPAAAIAVACCLGLELARRRLPVAGAHAAFILLCAGAHAFFLRGLVARQRREHEKRLEGEVRALRQEARDFRLIAAALGAESRAPRTREEEERKLAEGAVETIHASMFYTVEMLKTSLGLHTCVLLWLDETGARLTIKELITESDAVVETSLPADAGALGAVVRDRLLVNLTGPKRGHVPYYAVPEEVAAFLGVPVLEDGHLRGVLCADRRGGEPFGERDEKLMLGAAAQILRAIQSERVFVAVERSKYEHERFYHASAMLGRALTLEQVMDTAFEAARQICDFEMASISLFDKERRRHRVWRVSVAEQAAGLVDAEQLDGLEFGENAGLAAMVVKNKHYLPAGGELRDPSIPIFSKKIKLHGVESLLVMPLICADEAIGTFTLASRARAAFGKDAREMLGIIAHQVAVSLANAKMYRQMETMATTDGLTGLFNHRTFQERLTDMIGRAERHGMKLGVILCDIDHFKKINDTYGHPMGDQVLVRVARLLEKAARKIDVVARYGGEEFAIIMEGADATGAQGLAERIRQDVAAQTFQSEQGTFSVTLSLGVASAPDDASEKHALVERADQALYHGKHNGRNRSVTYAQFLTERAARSKALAKTA